MQRGGRSSPCCLQAVTVWIRALQPPLTITDAPPKRATYDPRTSSQRFTDSNPIPDSRRLCPQRSFLPKTLLFLARLKLCAPRSLRSTSYRRELRCACAVLPCADTGGQGSNGLMGFKGVREGDSGGDTKVTFLLIVWTK